MQKFNYGLEFESKLLTSIISNDVFLAQIADVLKPEYFESRGANWIVEKAIEYYNTYTKAPSYLVIETEIKGLKKQDNLFSEELQNFVAFSKGYEQSEDLGYVQDKALEFCKNQALKLAIRNSIPLLEDNDYDGIKSLIDEAYKLGYSRDIGHNYKDDFEKRYAEDARTTVPTPWTVINNITQGGLSMGELGIVVAPSGAGKSWVLAALGAHAVKEGKNVVHYTLELNKIYTSLRYDSIFSEVESSQLLLHKDSVKEKIDALKGTLIVEDYPNKSASVNTLRGHLNRCISKDIIPDLIIVDYGDLLKGAGKDLRNELNQIYVSLRALAAEYSCPVWTASQSNRSSIEEEVIQANRISEDYSKIFTGDFIFSLSRRAEDKVTGFAKIHIIKNRFGPDGLTYPCKMDARVGKIQIYEEGTKEGQNIIASTIEHSQKKKDEGILKYSDLLDEFFNKYES